MKDSGYILVGFLGVSAGKPKASFVRSRRCAKKSGFGLGGIVFFSNIFPALDKDDIYCNTASSLRLLLVKGLMQV